MLHRHFTLVLGRLFIFSLCFVSFSGCGGGGTNDPDLIDPTPTPTVTPTGVPLVEPTTGIPDGLWKISAGNGLKFETRDQGIIWVYVPVGAADGVGKYSLITAGVAVDRQTPVTAFPTLITLSPEGSFTVGNPADPNSNWIQGTIQGDTASGTAGYNSADGPQTYSWQAAYQGPATNNDKPWFGSAEVTPAPSPTPTPSDTPTPTPTPTTTPTPSVTPTPTPPLGEDTITVSCGDGVDMTLVKIPAGTFQMGDITGIGYSTERPVHTVTISKDYYMGIYEVTQAQWKAAMGTEPWKGQSYVLEQGNCPATYVSWNDAVAFCQALSTKSGRTIRLPSEAEWEYACKAGSGDTKFYFGNDDAQLGNYAWYAQNTWNVNERYAHAVGQKSKNNYELYDMHGNVWEWCQDWWHNDYTNAPSNGIAWETPSGTYRVLRGGSLYDYGDACRSAYRSGVMPTVANGIVGFRVVSGN